MWLLYFLFAYLDGPPTDETLETFERAHDRAMGKFSDPDMLVRRLDEVAKTKKEKAAQVSLTLKWQRFRKRYGHKTKRELMEVIAFFLNEKLSNHGSVSDQEYKVMLTDARSRDAKMRQSEDAIASLPNPGARY